METKFQTSFIPKKPLMPQETSRSRAPTSIFMSIGILIFIVSLVAAGLSFFAKDYLLKAQVKLKEDLAENEKRFNEPLIEKIKKANLKIDIAKELLKNHAAVSEAFNIIATLTAEKVYFTSFEIMAPEAAANATGGTTGSYKIRMKGVADSFNSIAWQSDVFNKSVKYGTTKVVKNPVLSDLIVDQSGNVSFFFSAELALPDISYSKTLENNISTE